MPLVIAGGRREQARACRVCRLNVFIASCVSSRASIRHPPGLQHILNIRRCSYVLYTTQVSVYSPILMRTLASTDAIERCVAAAGVTGEVDVIASWSPCRLVVWSTDVTGTDDVGKVVSRVIVANPSIAAQFYCC